MKNATMLNSTETRNPSSWPAASVVVSGTELLSGLHRDTNTSFIERRLARLGMATRFAATVGDRIEEMVPIFRHALEAAPVLITSGGLGPTVDDLTREALAEATGVPLVHSDDALRELEACFRRIGRKMSDNNLRQAQVPSTGQFFGNPHGTAPGLLFDAGERIAIALPGPPRELEPMMENHIVPLLRERYPDLQESSRVRVRLVGIGESNVDQLLRDKVVLDEDMDLSLLAKLGRVDVTLSLPGSRPDDLGRLERVRDKVMDYLGQFCYSIRIDETLEEAVGSLLRERGETIGTAESCTGGGIASVLTSIAGSSDYVTGSLVTYSNDAKQSLAGVREETLREHGAVSEATVLEMAEGCLDALGCDWSIAVSGIAGPGGGTPEKPVGTVWIAIGHRGGTPTAQRFQFPGDRASVRERAQVSALGALFRRMNDER